MRLLNALHSAQASADDLCWHAAGPVGPSLASMAPLQRQQFGDRRGRQRCTAERARLVSQLPGGTCLGEVRLAAPRLRTACTALARDVEHAQPLRGQKNDPVPVDVPLRFDCDHHDRRPSASRV
jgi:hypothetical protein